MAVPGRAASHAPGRYVRRSARLRDAPLQAAPGAAIQRACRREYNCSTWAAASCRAEAFLRETHHKAPLRHAMVCLTRGIPAGPHAMETDASDDPLHRGALGVHGGVVETEHVADCGAACGMLTSRRVRHIRASSWRPTIVDYREGAQLPGN